MKKNLLYCFVLIFFAGFLFPSSRFFTSPFVFGDNLWEKIENRENLSAEEIIEAALVFSGDPLSQEAGISILKRFTDLEKELLTEKINKKDDKEKSERILLLMYDSLLKTYQEEKTTVEILFEKGEYNCVSSAILFLALGKSQGLDVRGQKTTEHAFCKVYEKNNGSTVSYIVETTNPFGFDPGTRKKVVETENYLQYIYVPKINYSGQREVNDLYLCGLVASNLCSLAMKENDYEKAIPMAYGLMSIRDYFLEKDSEEVENLFSGACTNYIFYLQSQGKYEESLEFMDGLNRHKEIPGLDMLKKSLEMAFENYFYEKIREKDFDGAGNFLKINNRFVSPSFFKNLEKEWWIYKIQDEMKPVTENNCPANILDEKLSYLSEIQDSLKGESRATGVDRKIAEWKEYIWQKKIINSARNNDFNAALDMFEMASDDLGKSSNLDKLKKQVLGNYESVIHNKFAFLFNDSNFKEAEKVINEGIRLYPASKIFKKDLELLNKALGG